MGDANLCLVKWKEEDFDYPRLANKIQKILSQCGMINIDLGFTYMADRVREDGKITCKL